MNCPDCACEKVVTEFEKFLQAGHSESELLKMIESNSGDYIRCYKKLKKFIKDANDSEAGSKFKKLVRQYKR